MKNYLVHDAAGLILRTGSCDDADLPLQAQGAETVIEGQASLSAHYIVNGNIVAYTAAERQAMASMRPGQRWQMPERVVVDSRTLAQAKAQKLAEISRRCDATLKPIKEGYPEAEQQTWDKQEREAREGGATPLLSALAAARGIDLGELKARVIAKADAFAAYSGAAIGRRQRCEDQIEAAQTVAEVDAIQWESV